MHKQTSRLYVSGFVIVPKYILLYDKYLILYKIILFRIFCFLHFLSIVKKNRISFPLSKLFLIRWFMYYFTFLYILIIYSPLHELFDPNNKWQIIYWRKKLVFINSIGVMQLYLVSKCLAIAEREGYNDWQNVSETYLYRFSLNYQLDISITQYLLSVFVVWV